MSLQCNAEYVLEQLQFGCDDIRVDIECACNASVCAALQTVRLRRVTIGFLVDGRMRSLEAFLSAVQTTELHLECVMSWSYQLAQLLQRATRNSLLKRIVVHSTLERLSAHVQQHLLHALGTQVVMTIHFTGSFFGMNESRIVRARGCVIELSAATAAQHQNDRLSWRTAEESGLDEFCTFQQCSLKSATFFSARSADAASVVAESSRTLEQIEFLSLAEGDNEQLLQILPSSPALKHLEIRTSSSYSPYLGSVIGDIDKLSDALVRSDSMPKITQLSLHDISFNVEETARMFASCRSFLAELSLDGCRLQAPGNWVSIFEALPKSLKHIEVRNLQLLENCFAPVCTSLRALPCLEEALLFVRGGDVSANGIAEFQELVVASRNLTRAAVMYGGNVSFLSLASTASARIEWVCNNVMYEQADHVARINQRNRCCIGKARRAVLTFLCARKFGNSILNFLMKDLVKMIAKLVWESRRNGNNWYMFDCKESRVKILRFK